MDVKFSIVNLFPPEATSEEFWKWCQKEVRSKYPKGKIITKFDCRQIPLKSNPEKMQTLVKVDVIVKDES